MIFLSRSWTTGNFGENKLLKVRVCAGEPGAEVADPTVEYEVFDTLNSLLIFEGQFSLWTKYSDLMSSCLKACLNESFAGDKIVVPAQRLAYLMVLELMSAKFCGQGG